MKFKMTHFSAEGDTLLVLLFRAQDMTRALPLLLGYPVDADTAKVEIMEMVE